MLIYDVNKGKSPSVIIFEFLLIFYKFTDSCTQISHRSCDERNEVELSYIRRLSRLTHTYWYLVMSDGIDAEVFKAKTMRIFLGPLHMISTYAITFRQPLLLLYSCVCVIILVFSEKS